MQPPSSVPLYYRVAAGLLTQADALVRYLGLSLWPHPLVLDYGTDVATNPMRVFVPGLLLLALVLIVQGSNRLVERRYAQVFG